MAELIIAYCKVVGSSCTDLEIRFEEVEAGLEAGGSEDELIIEISFGLYEKCNS
jgi:hypothetical protein